MREKGSRLAFLFTVAASVGALTFLFVTPPAVAQTAVSVTISNFAFTPSSITVVIGVNNTVTWTNEQSGVPYHTVTPDAGDPVESWGSGQLTTGQSTTFTFTVAGTYNYHCSLHTYMKGTVKVIGSSSGTTSTSSVTSSSSSTTTTTSSSTPSTTTTSATSPTSTSTTSSSSGGIPEFPFQGVLIAVVTLALVGSYFVFRRHPGSRGPLPSPG